MQTGLRALTRGLLKLLAYGGRGEWQIELSCGSHLTETACVGLRPGQPRSKERPERPARRTLLDSPDMTRQT